MENFTKQAIVHHNADPDGWCSAALAIHFFKNEIEKGTTNLYGYNYEDTANWMEDDIDLFQFIDCTPPIAWLKKHTQEIIDGTIKLVIFDHHEAKWEEITDLKCYIESDYFDYYYESNMSAAKIYSKQLGIWAEEFGFEKLNLFLDGYAKKVVEFVSAYDIWDFPDFSESHIKKVLAFQEFSRCYCNSPEKFYMLLIVEQPDFINVIYPKGFAICDYQYSNAKQRLNRAKRIKVDGKKALLLEEPANYFAEKVISEKFEDDPLDCIIFYKMNPAKKNVKISIRSAAKGKENDMNCVEFIQKNFDKTGGGHKEACGGEISFDTLIEFLN